MKPIPCGSELCPAVQKIIVINAEWGKARPQHRSGANVEVEKGHAGPARRLLVLRTALYSQEFGWSTYSADLDRGSERLEKIVRSPNATD
ncbi:hypothetical protein Y032_0765g2165 [Ancylostoma ceylanicum]|uniref:Uncharacterized protein n=1 Tax=Ancylostoma ceylanicum TaxID=53326 RepID=A0A016WDX1_9BILA|nr:hypothetical protein Y032_0765g2165 [Ancylostoma ceylanicum]